MKKLFKNKQGFTLIELLVVIGILAVLAAIAIPSVAGLIDRANKSADNSNAVEMTNAVERFVSEYELYKQDIASGTFDKTNLDSAQGRVYNVTGIESREQVTKFESTGLNGKGVDLDSKYPVNEETLKAVIQNYMKTSSSTFEPKQSDCQYWYSPECGRVIVGEVGSKSSELTAIGFDDASVNTVLDTTEQYDDIHWICLDAETENHIANENGELEKWTNISIEPVEELTFSINGVTYTYLSDMTWNDWLTSDYNTSNYTIIEGQTQKYLVNGETCNGCSGFYCSQYGSIGYVPSRTKVLVVSTQTKGEIGDCYTSYRNPINFNDLISKPLPQRFEQENKDYHFISYSFFCLGNSSQTAFGVYDEFDFL